MVTLHIKHSEYDWHLTSVSMCDMSKALSSAFIPVILHRGVLPGITDVRAESQGSKMIMNQTWAPMDCDLSKTVPGSPKLWPRSERYCSTRQMGSNFMGVFVVGIE